MIPLNYYLILSAIVFGISLAGIVINRRNIIILLMCIELMLLAVNFNFVVFSQYFGLRVGELFVFFVLAVAAAESAVGLAILVLIFRRKKSIDIQDLSMLKG